MSCCSISSNCSTRPVLARIGVHGVLPALVAAVAYKLFEEKGAALLCASGSLATSLTIDLLYTRSKSEERAASVLRQGLNRDHHIIKTYGDGSCFFYALSMQLDPALEDLARRTYAKIEAQDGNASFDWKSDPLFVNELKPKVDAIIARGDAWSSKATSALAGSGATLYRDCIKAIAIPKMLEVRNTLKTALVQDINNDAQLHDMSIPDRLWLDLEESSVGIPSSRQRAYAYAQSMLASHSEPEVKKQMALTFADGLVKTGVGEEDTAMWASDLLMMFAAKHYRLCLTVHEAGRPEREPYREGPLPIQVLRINRNHYEAIIPR